jgi:hypothetical protein
MIARAKGKHFLVYNGVDQVRFDDKPKSKPSPPTSSKAANVA